MSCSAPSWRPHSATAYGQLWPRTGPKGLCLPTDDVSLRSCPFPAEGPGLCLLAHLSALGSRPWFPLCYLAMQPLLGKMTLPKSDIPGRREGKCSVLRRLVWSNEKMPLRC